MPLCRLPPALKTQHIPALGRRTFPEPKPCPCLAQMRALRLGKVPRRAPTLLPLSWSACSAGLLCCCSVILMEVVKATSSGRSRVQQILN